MASNAQSIHFDLFEGGLADVVETLRRALPRVSGLQTTPKYTLANWSDDDSEHEIVAMSNGAPSDSLPVIEEPAQTFNAVTFHVYIDGAETAFQVLVAVRAKRKLINVGLIFMSDVLEEGSLGASAIVKMLDGLLPSLARDSAIICNEDDEGMVGRRTWDGESVASIVLARAKGQDALPPPLLALVRADLCDEETLHAIRAAGVKVRMTLHGYIVLATVDV